MWVPKIPDWQAQNEVREAEERAHREQCSSNTCSRCGWFTCSECKAQKQKDRRQSNLCDDCRSRLRRANWMRPALRSIPGAFVAMSFDEDWLQTLVGPGAWKQAKDMLRSSRLAFVGPPGSGKTSLAVAMFVERLRLDAEEQAPMGGASTSRCTSAHALAKARVGHPLGQGEAPLVAEMLAADVLIVDELGGEDARHASAVAEVVYERHAEGLTTWVTTGVGPKEIADRYGGGIARRIFEDAGVFRLKGKR